MEHWYGLYCEKKKGAVAAQRSTYFCSSGKIGSSVQDFFCYTYCIFIVLKAFSQICLFVLDWSRKATVMAWTQHL